MINEAGAARIANGDIDIRRNRSALGRASIAENHGVNMKIMNTPMQTTIHDEYLNRVRAILDRNHCDTVELPHPKFGLNIEISSFPIYGTH